MPRTLNRLSPLRVKKLKRKGLHADGGGLYLRVTDGGTKSWMFRYGDGGKLRDMGLGPVHTISLPRARELARECRELRLQGIDPIAHRRAALAVRRASDAKVMTFRQCADAYIASHEAGWRNPSHRSQWTNTLAQHVYPVLGALPVAAIDTALVMKTIEPIWRTIPETASRVRGRIEAVLDWAKVSGYRTGENPARWRGHLDHLLPARAKVRRVEHHAALAYETLGAFMVDLRQDSSAGARALEFTILTAARTGEALGATWDEIDLTAKVWTIPAERMKGGREHRVPLSSAALALLKRMQSIRTNDFVFPGMRGRLTPKTMQLVLRRMGRRGLTVHGFRSSFRDWAAERTSFPREAVEMALAHAVSNAVEAAYRRGDLFDKRRKLMEAWAEFCGKPTASGRVVSIVGRRGGDDLAKAKILLAWATRVYGPDEEADEYTRDEYNRFLKMGCKIAGIEIETVGLSVEEVVATMLAEDREAARAAQVPPKRGRPPTPHRHLWITGSIEAYRGTGLRRKAAEIRAAREWDLHPSTIGKVYKVNKELKPISKEMRAIFDRDSKEGIDEAIRQFRESGRNGE